MEWKYKGDELIIKGNKQKRPVIQYDKNLVELNIFSSITEAKEKTGIKNIWDCCNDKNKTAGGFIWKYKQVII